MTQFVASLQDIVQIPVTPAMIDYANAFAHHGDMNRHSMMHGERNIEGVLGELGAYKYLPMLNYEPTTFHDLNLGDLTIDVKNKHMKNPSASIQLNHRCTIYGYESEKKCRIYLFTSTNHNHSIVYLKGYMLKQDLVTRDNFIPAGTAEPGVGVYRQDNYATTVRQLGKMTHLKALIEKHMDLFK